MNVCKMAAGVYPEISLPGLSGDYADIERAARIFAGDTPWKTAKKSGLYHSGTRSIHTIGTAKILCDYFSQLIFSEQPSFSASNAECQKFLDGVLNTSGFWRLAPEWLSFSFALGGGALKARLCGGEVMADFINADRFIPISWSGRNIDGGVFCSQMRKGELWYVLLERQSRNSDGEYFIEHRLFRSKTFSQLGDECPLSELYPDLPPLVICPDAPPLFAYFRPAGANNLHPDSPVGLSVFANAVDTIKALDVAFDSFAREFILGKKRIIVPSSCVQTVADIATGELRRYFDADDEAYVALKCDEESDLKIIDNTVTLRVDEHIKAINALLNLLCFQTGLSAGALSFDEIRGVRTATEILYRDNKTAAAAKANKNLLTEAFEPLAKAILYLGAASGAIPRDKAAECSVTIGWHDGIVCDDNTLIDNNIKLVNAGLKSKVSAMMEIFKCDEETARKELSQLTIDN
ncbi:MAG: phage portal protein [Oscillospiraceae bacterium]|nr:phage portal protein [Oscillospiraceae bacterium]